MLSGSRDGDWELLAVRTKSSAMSLEITVAAGGQQGGKEDTHLRDRSKEPSRRETHAHRLSGRKACVRLHMWRFMLYFSVLELKKMMGLHLSILKTLQTLMKLG